MIAVVAALFVGVRPAPAYAQGSIPTCPPGYNGPEEITFNSPPGAPFQAGDTIADQYASLGIHFSAAATAPGTGPLMAFDSSNPTGDDFDLGTPNEAFGGPGIGDDGGLTNQLPLGFVMIISEDGDSSDPDDSLYGGVITVTFDNPVPVYSLDVLDHDEVDSEVRAFDQLGNPIGAPTLLPQVGDNGWVNLIINKQNVKSLEIEMNGSGAIPTIVFCEDPPLAATLAGFNALSLAGEVMVTWETASEVNTLGFNILRADSPDGTPVAVNAALIPSQSPGGMQGASYQWIDSNVVVGGSYTYWLEDVDTAGVTTRHDPVTVTVENPTAVTLSDLSTDSAAPTGALLATTLALLGLAGLALRRRVTA